LPHEQDARVRPEDLVIFATCGSSPARFSRMMEALGALPPEELQVQHGPVSPPPCASAYDYLPFNRMVELIEAADVVVSHAGVGSIMCALRAGHVPIVFPRLKRYGETVDDHQAELAEALAKRGTVIVAWSVEELRDSVARVPPRSIAQQLGGEGLGAAVRAAIRGEAHSAFTASRGLGRRRSLRRRPAWAPDAGSIPEPAVIGSGTMER
jgi:UDP-N-acetylglucosamine transferase subunit ALG13